MGVGTPAKAVNPLREIRRQPDSWSKLGSKAARSARNKFNLLIWVRLSVNGTSASDKRFLLKSGELLEIAYCSRRVLSTANLATAAITVASDRGATSSLGCLPRSSSSVSPNRQTITCTEADLRDSFR